MRFLLIPLCILNACVAYRAQDIELDRLADELDAREVPALDFAGATAYARRHNPELKRLAAEARAAGLDVPATRLAAEANSLDDNAAALVDPLALAKVYQRGAAARSAHARQVAALAALREAERRIDAGIAETFLVERVLLGLRVPEIKLDAEQFARAGLASEAARQRAEFARKAEMAEYVAIRAERRANLARLRRLLALPPDALLELTLPEGEFPRLDDPTRERLLRRPDLAVSLARYYAADAEFREAVLRQYPSFAIGPKWNFGTGGVGGLVALQVPIGAGAVARAAGERREAARQAVVARLLAAQEEAEASHARMLATGAHAEAFADRAVAASTGLAAAMRRLDVEPDAFDHAASMASLAARTSIQARTTALLAARARVRYAEAYGWPTTEETR